MEMLGFRTVNSLPCLYHPELDLLVIADLHLGLEGSVTHDGHYVPQFQLEELKEDIRKAASETGAGRILVDGDLKHEFGGTRFSERKEVKEFVGLLEQLFDEVILVRGNHDNFLEEAVDLELVDSHLESGYLFVHGHEAIREAGYDTLVMGHEHPALRLEDEIGVAEKVDCFLYGEMLDGRSILVMPAFSKISGGQKVNSVPQGELLSPILRNEVDLGSLKAVGIDREAGVLEFAELEKLG